MMYFIGSCNTLPPTFEGENFYFIVPENEPVGKFITFKFVMETYFIKIGSCR